MNDSAPGHEPLDAGGGHGPHGPHGPRGPFEALAADTDVQAESGQWVVYVTVIFADGAVRNRIARYRTRRRADQAADIIRRAANRSGAARADPLDPFRA